MNTSPTARERAHLAWVKAQPCVVCGAAGPGHAHHVRQASAWHCVPLCPDCHQGSHNGIHGGRAMWRIQRMDETDALAATIRALHADGLAR